MENLIIKGGRNEFLTPSVVMDAESRICELAGESSLEYTGEFYDKVINWLKLYTTEVNAPLTFNFRLTYFNTSSYKALLSVLRYLKRYKDKGGEVIINWYYPEDDADMLMDAQDLAESADVDMVFVPYTLDD
jgi:SiaC family regulatory phosphoprotein